MGKKRRADGQPYGEPKARAKGQGNSKLRITTYEDVADSEDEFHLNRDRIMLEEGPDAKRMRKWREEDEFLQPSDTEIINYTGKEEDDDFSDEEEDVADEDNVADNIYGQRSEGEGEDLGGWGPSKKDYYDADAIETEQDALDEEAEALRLQRQQLSQLNEADFGFDEEEWLGQDSRAQEADSEGEKDVVTEVVSKLDIDKDMGEAERLDILNARYPEFEHVRREILHLQPLHDAIASAANATKQLARMRNERLGKDKNTSHQKIPVAVRKHRAISAYIGCLAMYLAILTSTATNDGLAIALDPTELHDHPVIERLVTTRKLWEKVEHLPMDEPVIGDELSVIEEASPSSETSKNGVVPTHDDKQPRKIKKSKAQLREEAARAEAEQLRAQKLLQTEEDLAALSSLTDKSTLREIAKQKKIPKSSNVILNPDDSDFGEEDALTTHELAEKARKKKSLRFYTSQIAQKANKRGAATRDYGGDIDVPHRERLKDRQARLQAEAEKRGRKNDGPGEALGGEGASDLEDAPPRGNDNGDQDEDYYDLVSARSKARKQEKQERAAAYAAAAAEGGNVYEQEMIGADGKRRISYAIQKNKGLTPSRHKKENRNPRVKKKLKYDAKKKKLKSQRAVFSGGEQRGGYQGELTGIKKGLVKSRKL